ncbi:Purine ribonucleoside efflux pump NepI [Streptomyces sp. RB17]|uniref:MFS transporter n=1 Tax=Streptomyces sp. RB17 TaxID=2585197 RepID=UPI0013063366|nr:MFS transporter [Streptomyces sp. RB17]MQY36230.1 Purine ribonucleoside efflux pump NepI [Streptomyces sp. RB17]
MGTQRSKFDHAPSPDQEFTPPNPYIKGFGSWLRMPDEALITPADPIRLFEEPEVALVYVNDDGGVPHYARYAFGDDLNDIGPHLRNPWAWTPYAKLCETSLTPGCSSASRPGPRPDGSPSNGTAPRPGRATSRAPDDGVPAPRRCRRGSGLGRTRRLRTASGAPHLQGRAIALTMAGVPLALSLGIPLGTFLGGLFGWRLTFDLVTLISVALLGWITMSVPDAPGRRPEAREPALKALSLPGVVAALFVVAAYVLAHNILCTCVATFLDAYDMGGSRDVVLLVLGIASVVSIWIKGAPVDRTSQPWCCGASAGEVSPRSSRPPSPTQEATEDRPCWSPRGTRSWPAVGRSAASSWTVSAPSPSRGASSRSWPRCSSWRSSPASTPSPPPAPGPSAAAGVRPSNY